MSVLPVCLSACNSNSNIGICIALPTGKTGSALHGQLRSFGRKGPIEQNSFQTALEGSCMCSSENMRMAQHAATPCILKITASAWGVIDYIEIEHLA